MDPHPCPRCGTPVHWSGLGRKPRWCSDNCRRRGSEGRRDSIQVREVVRERVVEHRIRDPLNPTSAAAVVLDDIDATRSLVRQLAARLTTAAEAFDRVQLLGLTDDIEELFRAARTALAREMPQVAAHREALRARAGDPAAAMASAAVQKSPAQIRGKRQRKKRRRRHS
jgi:hypothetical protein